MNDSARRSILEYIYLYLTTQKNKGLQKRMTCENRQQHCAHNILLAYFARWFNCDWKAISQNGAYRKKKLSISLRFSRYSLNAVYYRFTLLYFYCFVKLGDISFLSSFFSSIIYWSAYMFRLIIFTFLLFITLFNDIIVA